MTPRRCDARRILRRTASRRSSHCVPHSTSPALKGRGRSNSGSRSTSRTLRLVCSRQDERAAASGGHPRRWHGGARPGGGPQRAWRGGPAPAGPPSEPGWQRQLDSITVYQRGWRLGGKGASSRGPNSRIEEHGLHLWLGYYENAFRLLRECYRELDRPSTDHAAPIQTWRDAMIPADTVGLEDRRPDGWHHWLGQFTPNELLPGDPDAGGGELTMPDIFRRALQLITDFLESLPDDPVAAEPVVLSGSPQPPLPVATLGHGLRLTVLAAVLEVSALLRGGGDRSGSVSASVFALDRAITATNEALERLTEDDPDLRRTWHLVAVMTAVVRGMLADGLFTGQRSFRDLNDEDFLDWIFRH